MTDPADIPVPPEPTPDQRVEVMMPDDLVAGVHADLVGVWHTSDSFILDFSSLVEPARLHDLDGVPTVVQRARVVSRVRVPPSQVFEIMKALELQLSAWERETGNNSSRP